MISAGLLAPTTFGQRLRDPGAAIPVRLDAAWKAANLKMKLFGKTSEVERDEELEPVDRGC